MTDTNPPRDSPGALVPDHMFPTLTAAQIGRSEAGRLTNESQFWIVMSKTSTPRTVQSRVTR
jgi:hypothetical protein